MSDKDPESIWIGPVGPIPIIDGSNPRRQAANAAGRIAQAAVDCHDLIALVAKHPDPLVRMQAVPRLKARFPEVAAAHEALIQAVTDADESVRCEAISAVSDLGLLGASDLLAAALSDAEPDVRFFAAVGLQRLGDERAPNDPEAFAYHS